MVAHLVGRKAGKICPEQKVLRVAFGLGSRDLLGSENLLEVLRSGSAEISIFMY